MKKFTLLLLAFLSVVGVKAETVVFEGEVKSESTESEVTQSVASSKFANLVAGDYLRVTVNKLTADSWHQLVFKMNADPWTALTNLNYVGVDATGTFEYALTATDVANVKAYGVLIGVKACTVNKVSFRHANQATVTNIEATADASADETQASANVDFSEFSTAKVGDVVRFNLTPNSSGYHQVWVKYITGDSWNETADVLAVTSTTGDHYDFAISTDAILSYLQGTKDSDAKAVRFYVKNNTLKSLDLFTPLAITDVANPACEAGTFKKVNLTRSLISGYNTLCLPFTATKTELGLDEADEIYELTTGGTESTVKFASVDAVVANKPYVVKCDAARTLTSSFDNLIVAASDAASTTAGDWTMYANYEPSKSMNGNYIVYGDEIRKCGDGPTLNGLRAYFVYSGVDARESVAFDFGGGTTAINNVLTQGGNSVCYNLAGQRVDNPVKGLYIVNGKKVVVK